MRKVLLLAVEGYAAANEQSKPAGGGVGVAMTWEDALKRDFNKVLDKVDWVFLSQVASNCVAKWVEVSRQIEPERRYSFLRTIVCGHHRVLRNRKVARTRVATDRRIVKEIAALKGSEGKGILVYGDDESSRALLVAGLIDEVHLFINPAAVAARKSIFAKRPTLRRWLLSKARIYDSGFVYRKYLLVIRR